MGPNVSYTSAAKLDAADSIQSKRSSSSLPDPNNNVVSPTNISPVTSGAVVILATSFVDISNLETDNFSSTRILPAAASGTGIVQLPTGSVDLSNMDTNGNVNQEYHIIDNMDEIGLDPMIPASVTDSNTSDSWKIDNETNTDDGVWTPVQMDPGSGQETELDTLGFHAHQELIDVGVTSAANYVPFLLILMIKQLLDHGDGFVCMIALVLSFETSNFMLMREIARRSERRILCLIILSTNLLVCVGIVYFVYNEEQLYPALICLPTGLQPSTFSALLWIVCLTDYMAKIFTIIIKTVVVALPMRVLSFQHRGKYYVMIENSMKLYRSLLPMYPWLCYLFIPYQTTNQLSFGIIICVVYLLCKLVDLVCKGMEWRRAFENLFQPPHFGEVPKPSQIEAAGMCAICQDTFKQPKRLKCKHIFCHECLNSWFDRACTCPMCRKRAIPYPWHRNGSTDHFVQIF